RPRGRFRRADRVGRRGTDDRTGAFVTQDKLRVGVVGTGRWAIRSHIPGWKRDPRCEVVGLVDTNADALAAAGKEFGVSRLETDYRALTDDPDIDVIDVVTGNAAHYEVSMAALEAGK